MSAGDLAPPTTEQTPISKSDVVFPRLNVSQMAANLVGAIPVEA